MDTSNIKMKQEEKENVLLVLNEFSEEYSRHTKAVQEMMAEIKEVTVKITTVLNEQGEHFSNRDWIPQMKTAMENGFSELKDAIAFTAFPTKEAQDLARQIQKATHAMENPKASPVVHQHHVPKIIWISVSLFLALALVCSGWFMTHKKLAGYIANDTKYRLLRLDTAHHSLQLFLDRADSLYKVDPDLRKTVSETEEERRVNFERQQKAERLRNEATRLENAIQKE